MNDRRTLVAQTGRIRREPSAALAPGDAPPARAESGVVLREPAAVLAGGLVKRYRRDGVVALDGLSLRIERGEFVAICGPSGCGKSTLLNLIAGIDRPDAGALAVMGRPIARMGDSESSRFRAEVIGLVFQLHNLLPHLTAIENVQAAMFAGGRPAAWRVQRAAELLDRVGLGARLRSLPPNLSGGERQRVAIARALANDPQLLLADEPTGALDSKTGEQLFGLLAKLQTELGMTLLVVTHDRDVAARAGRVIHMRDGRVAGE